MDPVWRVTGRLGRRVWAVQAWAVAVLGLVSLAVAVVAGWRLGVAWGLVTAAGCLLLLVLWTARDMQKDLDEAEAAQPSVRLATTGQAFIDGDDECATFWAQLRATNKGQPTVLTDWAMTFHLGDQTHAGTHRPHAPMPKHMERLPALDAVTATTPFVGEAAGWVAFMLPIGYSTIIQAVEQGVAVSAVVRAEDLADVACRATLDVMTLWNAGHKHYSSTDSASSSGQ